MRPAGMGALLLALELLKRRLSRGPVRTPRASGRFRRFPMRVGLVTSPIGRRGTATGQCAARALALDRDRAWPRCAPGRGARPREIAAGSSASPAAGDGPVIVGRGGGSIEDLWAFTRRSSCARSRPRPRRSSRRSATRWSGRSPTSPRRARRDPSKRRGAGVRVRAEVLGRVERLADHMARALGSRHGRAAPPAPGPDREVRLPAASATRSGSSSSASTTSSRASRRAGGRLARAHDRLRGLKQRYGPARVAARDRAASPAGRGGARAAERRCWSSGMNAARTRLVGLRRPAARALAAPGARARLLPARQPTYSGAQRGGPHGRRAVAARVRPREAERRVEAGADREDEMPAEKKRPRRPRNRAFRARASPSFEDGSSGSRPRGRARERQPLAREVASPATREGMGLSRQLTRTLDEARAHRAPERGGRRHAAHRAGRDPISPPARAPRGKLPF